VSHPSIAVVIPCYNDGAYLTEALESLYRQTFPNWEAIIIDDGSTDLRTVQVLERINDTKVKVYHHEKNKGLSAARNTGIRLSTAPIIFPLDSDDQLAPNALEVAIDAFHHAPHVDLFYPDLERFGSETGVIRNPEMDLALMIRRPFAHACSPFKRGAWEKSGGFNEEETMRLGMEDVDFHLSLLEHGCRFQRLPEPIYRYRAREGSLSDKMQRHNYTIRKYIANRHRRILKGRLRREFLHIGAVRSYRYAVRERAFGRAALCALCVARWSIWPPRMWWRALWNITAPLQT
jgi:glycosyltransferase involved in cell wall biosynthesis